MTTLTREFRLTKTVRPVRYELRFDLDLDRWISKGFGRIALRVDERCHEIVLHALELKIGRARLDDGLAVQRVDTDDVSQTATLRFASEIEPGLHSLEVEWTGPIREGLRGLYRAAYGGQPFAATQFEAAEARRAFPCFDEPEFKAEYRLEIVHDSKLTALANGAIAGTELLPDGRKLTRFAGMPKISSYLVAFTVGPYEGTEEVRTTTGTPVRVWLPRGLAAQGAYARGAHARAVVWLENYTGIGYPYRKVDAIGIPDFEAGAMENPGAITYRTQLLAADPTTATTMAFKHIFSVAAHELTHMWWGDLVTMAWWNDLWLNESFASFVGEKATDALNPEWHYLRDVVAEARFAYSLDQLVTTHPISMEVRTPDQASERFDAVTYQKGAAVLRMIESFVGEEAFRDGVRIYLNRHAESNATADDFWRALDEASGRDVTTIANSWIREPGHPIIECSLRESTNGVAVEFSQQRFYFDPDVRPTSQRWPVPIVVKYGTRQGVREERLLLQGDRATVTLPRAEWYYPNAGARGFYRYALDDGSLSRLAGAVGNLEPEERLMLVDNQWTLIRAGRVHLGQLFELLAGLRGEEDRAVVDAIADALGWLSTHAVRDEDRFEFERFVGDLFRPLFDQLGWDRRPSDDTETRELRARVLGMLGRVARTRDVQDEARRRIEAYLAGSLTLDPDLTSALAVIAATDGDEELYERYLARRQAAETTDAQEEQRFRLALAAFERPSLVERTAEACFAGFVRTQDRGLMLSSLLGSRHGRDVTWRMVRERWDSAIAPLDTGVRHRMVAGVGQLTPRPLANEAAGFLKEKKSSDTVEVTSQTLERLRLNAAVAERLSAALRDALRRAKL